MAGQRGARVGSPLPLPCLRDKAELVNEHKDVAEMTLSLRWELAWALRYARSVDPRTPLTEGLRRIAADTAARDGAEPEALLGNPERQGDDRG